LRFARQTSLHSLFSDFDATVRLVLLYEVGTGPPQDRVRRPALRSLWRTSWRAGVQDVMRSHPDLVRTGRRSAVRNLLGQS